MPLISCPDCSQRVSSSAESCPNCGFPISKHSTTGKVKLRKGKSLVSYINNPLKIITFTITVLCLVVAISTRTQPDGDVEASGGFLMMSLFFGVLWLALNVDTWFQKS
jgi:hypothetical protein